MEIFPAYEEERAIRVEFFGDEIETISEIDPLRGIARSRSFHAVTHLSRRATMSPPWIIESARSNRFAWSCASRLTELGQLGKPMEAQRLSQRTLFDLGDDRRAGILPRGSRTTRAI